MGHIVGFRSTNERKNTFNDRLKPRTETRAGLDLFWGMDQQIPCASMACATFSKPAMLAPAMRSPSMPYFLAASTEFL